MTALLPTAPEAAPGVATTQSPEGLRAFRGCAAAIWRRQPVPGFTDRVDSLAPELLPRCRVILRPVAVRAVAAEVCATAGTPAPPERDRLVGDIAALADRLAGLMRARWLRSGSTS